MKRSLLVLVIIFAFVSIAQQAEASGFPGHLDEFCRTAEYIVVAKCVDRKATAAKLKIETLYKAPKADSKPAFLNVNGLPGSATLFYFEEEKRYFAFVFNGGRCDRRGSHFQITRDDKLTGAARELICLEENTDTLGKLTRQVKQVLSGEYEEELIARIGNKERSYDERRTDALRLSRVNPETAITALDRLLLEISRQPDVNGSSRGVYMKLLELNSSRAMELSLKILSNTETTELYFEAAEVLAEPKCRLDNFQEHYAMLMTAAQKWEKNNPSSGYAHMLPVFVNNDCRTPEVMRMLLAELSSPDIAYFDLVSQSTLALQFPESLPLFWKQIKKELQTSDHVNLDIYIARHVGAATVYDRENFERLEVWMGKNLIRRVFPEYTKSLADAEVIRVNKSLLFLIAPHDRKRQMCLYVGFEGNKGGKINHKVFVLFDEK